MIKARHSAFDGTPLEYLRRQLGIERIMLVPVAEGSRL